METIERGRALFPTGTLELRAGLTVVQTEGEVRKNALVGSIRKGAASASNGEGRPAGEERLRLLVISGDQPVGPALDATLHGRASNGKGNACGEASGTVIAPVFLLDAASVQASPDTLAAALAAERLPAAPTHAHRQLEHAWRTLGREAEELLDNDGGGRIGRIARDLAVVRQRLEAAREAESQQAARRGRAAPRTAEAVRARELLADHRAESERIRQVLEIWPLWQEREELRSALTATVPVDLGRLAECSAARQRLAAARANVRALSRRRDFLAMEHAELSPDTRLLAVGERARRLAEHVSTYRDDLIVLAARRARCQDLEANLAKGLEEMQPPIDVETFAELDPDRVDSEAINLWASRVGEAIGRAAGMEEDEEETRAYLASLSAQITARLDGEPEAGETTLDREWRVLCRLRAALDSLWVVQSEGEGRARVVQEWEKTLNATDASGFVGLPPFLRPWLAGLVAIALVALLGFAFLGKVMPAALCAVGAVGLLLADYVLGWSLHAAAVQRGRRLHDDARARREIERARSERDEAWRHAADLQRKIARDAEALGLGTVPTLEAVDRFEQDLARRTTVARVYGASDDSLGARMLEMLDREAWLRSLVEDVEAARADEQSVWRGWNAWRTEAGLPDGLAPEDARTWVERVRELREVRVQAAAARDELRQMEPRIAVWEGAARLTLARAGADIAGDLCGTALVDEVRSLTARASEAQGRAARRARVESERDDVQRRLAEAEAEMQREGAELTKLLASIGAASEDALETLARDASRRSALIDSIDQCERSIEELLSAQGRASVAGDRSSAQLRALLERGKADEWHRRLADLEVEVAAAERAWTAALEGLDAQTRLWLEMGESTEVPTLELECAGLTMELEVATRRWRVLAVAKGLIEETSRELQRTERRAILRDASCTLEGLTDGRYTQILFDESGPGLTLLERAGRRVRVDCDLDAGARVRLGLSIRLAIARYRSRQHADCPLIVDDVLRAFDPAGTARAAAELVAYAAARPVLYFTSEPSTWEHLSRLDGGARLIEA